MKKILPILLIAAPYIFLADIFLLILYASTHESFFGYALAIMPISYFVMVAIVFIPNIICAIFRCAKGESSKRLLFWNLIIKLCHIPFYIVMFILGFFMAVLSLKLLGPIFIAIAIAIIDYSLLLASSVYGITGIFRAKKEGKLSLSAVVLHTLMHFIFVFDIISAIYVYAKSKKQIGEANV